MGSAIHEALPRHSRGKERMPLCLRPRRPKKWHDTPSAMSDMAKAPKPQTRNIPRSDGVSFDFDFNFSLPRSATGPSDRLHHGVVREATGGEREAKREPFGRWSDVLLVLKGSSSPFSWWGWKADAGAVGYDVGLFGLRLVHLSLDRIPPN